MKRIFKNCILLAVILMVIFSGTYVVSYAASGSRDFSFCFSFNGDYAQTDARYKSTNDFLSMQCTWAESSGATYMAWPIYNEEIYCRNRYIFSEGTWKAIDYFGPTGVNVYLEGCLIDDDGYDGHIFDGYWYVDSGLSQ